MADNKTKPTLVDVSAFIDALPDENRRADAKALVKLMRSATGEKPAMWGPSIVGFGSYHYKYESGREGDMPLAGFSPRKAATVIYNMTSPSRQAHDRRRLPLHQEARRRGSKGLGDDDPEIDSGQESWTVEIGNATTMARNLSESGEENENASAEVAT